MSGEANLRRSSDSDDHLRPEPLLSWQLHPDGFILSR
jgi:hypothetical protein